MLVPEPEEDRGHGISARMRGSVRERREGGEGKRGRAHIFYYLDALCN